MDQSARSKLFRVSWKKMSKIEIDPLEQARLSVQQDLGWISSDNFDASFRDSIVLCSHILDTHQARLGGLEKAAGILAPMRTSVSRVSTQLSDIWGPYAGEHVASPLDYKNKSINHSKWGKEQPRLVSYLRNSPDPNFSFIAERERAKRSPTSDGSPLIESISTKGWNSIRAAVGRSLGGGPELVRAKLAVLVAPLDDDSAPSNQTNDEDTGVLTLAARVAQLEKMANRHDYK